MQSVNNIYGRLPVSYLAFGLKKNELKVAVALSSFQGHENYCYPSLLKIGERANIRSRHEVSRAISNLIKLGIIIKKKQSRKPNIYQFIYPKYDICYASIPIALLYDDLGKNAILVYGALSAYQADKGICYPKRKDIATRIGMNNLYDVSRAISNLKSKSWLKMIRRGANANFYSVNLSKSIRVARNTHMATPHVAKNTHIKSDKKSVLPHVARNTHHEAIRVARNTHMATPHVAKNSHIQHDEKSILPHVARNTHIESTHVARNTHIEKPRVAKNTHIKPDKKSVLPHVARNTHIESTHVVRNTHIEDASRCRFPHQQGVGFLQHTSKRSFKISPFLPNNRTSTLVEEKTNQNNRNNNKAPPEQISQKLKPQASIKNKRETNWRSYAWKKLLKLKV